MEIQRKVCGVRMHTTVITVWHNTNMQHNKDGGRMNVCDGVRAHITHTLRMCGGMNRNRATMNDGILARSFDQYDLTPIAATTNVNHWCECNFSCKIIGLCINNWQFSPSNILHILHRNVSGFGLLIAYFISLRKENMQFGSRSTITSNVTAFTIRINGAKLGPHSALHSL